MQQNPSVHQTMEESAGLFSSFTDFPGFLITLQCSVDMARLGFEYE